MARCAHMARGMGARKAHRIDAANGRLDTTRDARRKLFASLASTSRPSVRAPRRRLRRAPSALRPSRTVRCAARRRRALAHLRLICHARKHARARGGGGRNGGQ
jgi:hypothetical protein